MDKESADDFTDNFMNSAILVINIDYLLFIMLSLFHFPHVKFKILTACKSLASRPSAFPIAEASLVSARTMISLASEYLKENPKVWPFLPYDLNYFHPKNETHKIPEKHKMAASNMIVLIKELRTLVFTSRLEASADVSCAVLKLLVFGDIIPLFILPIFTL
jgi:hypothetical protein